MSTLSEPSETEELMEFITALKEPVDPVLWAAIRREYILATAKSLMDITIPENKASNG